MSKESKKKFEFSKLIIVFETFLVLILTICVLGLIRLSIVNAFDGSFPYLTTMVTAAWGAYGVSVSFYYNKAKFENEIKLKGIENETQKEIKQYVEILRKEHLIISGEENDKKEEPTNEVG